jgi:hypothetical protein
LAGHKIALSADDRKSSAPIKSSGAASRLMARVATFAARRESTMTPPGAGASMVRVGRGRRSHHENDRPEGTRPFQKHDPERDISRRRRHKESLGEDLRFFVAEGLIEKPVKVEDVLDISFVENAVSKLGPYQQPR